MGSHGLEANSVRTWCREEGNHTADLPRTLYRHLLSSNSFYSQKCPSYDLLLQKSEQWSPGATGVGGPAQKHPGKGKRELPAVTGMGCIFTGMRARWGLTVHPRGHTSALRHIQTLSEKRTREALSLDNKSRPADLRETGKLWSEGGTCLDWNFRKVALTTICRIGFKVWGSKLENQWEGLCDHGREWWWPAARELQQEDREGTKLRCKQEQRWEGLGRSWINYVVLQRQHVG